MNKKLKSLICSNLKKQFSIVLILILSVSCFLQAEGPILLSQSIPIPDYYCFTGQNTSYLTINADGLWEAAEDISYGITYISEKGGPLRVFSDEPSVLDKNFIFYTPHSEKTDFLRTTQNHDISIDDIPGFYYEFGYGITIIGRLWTSNRHIGSDYIKIEVGDTTIEEVTALDSSSLDGRLFPEWRGINGFPVGPTGFFQWGLFYNGKNVWGNSTGNVIVDVRRPWQIYEKDFEHRIYEIKENQVLVIAQNKSPFDLYAPELTGYTMPIENEGEMYIHDLGTGNSIKLELERDGKEYIYDSWYNKIYEKPVDMADPYSDIFFYEGGFCYGAKPSNIGDRPDTCVFVIEEDGKLKNILRITNMTYFSPMVEFVEREGSKLYVSLCSLGFEFDMETGKIVRAFRNATARSPFHFLTTVEIKPFGGNVYVQCRWLYDDK